MAHHKHPPIKRPPLGFYARTEFSLVGTTCARIDAWLTEWKAALSDEFRVLTVSGDHGKEQPASRRQYGAKVLDTTTSWNEYDDKLLGSQYDLALVNGNHYPAARQIVFIDKDKAGTLERRREQLTDILTVVICPGNTEVPGWLRDHLPDEPIVYTFAEWQERGVEVIRNLTRRQRAPLKALILTGGKSTRMGADKAKLVYQNDQGEADRLADICRAQGLDTYFSVRKTGNNEQEIPDRFLGLGPLGAIASAFLADPDAAWLVLACDLPLLDAGTIGRLIANRTAGQCATAVRGASRPFPEPLIAIYEPRAYARLLQFLSIGYACPRKVLINSPVKEIVLEDEAPLTNANTPEERAAVLKRLD